MLQFQEHTYFAWSSINKPQLDQRLLARGVLSLQMIEFLSLTVTELLQNVFLHGRYVQL